MRKEEDRSSGPGTWDRRICLGVGALLLALGLYSLFELPFRADLETDIGDWLVVAACLLPGGLFFGAGLVYKHPFREFPAFPVW